MQERRPLRLTEYRSVRPAPPVPGGTTPVGAVLRLSVPEAVGAGEPREPFAQGALAEWPPARLAQSVHHTVAPSWGRIDVAAACLDRRRTFLSSSGCCPQGEAVDRQEPGAERRPHFRAGLLL